MIYNFVYIESGEQILIPCELEIAKHESKLDLTDKLTETADCGGMKVESEASTRHIIERDTLTLLP